MKKDGDKNKQPRKKLSKIFATYALAGVALIGTGFGLQKGVDAITHDPAPAAVVELAERQQPVTPSMLHVQHGDGHPVLVIPGFFGNHPHTAELESKIRAQGYAVYGWEAGLNLDPSESKAKHLEQRLKTIYDADDHRKVSLVGYGLGGVYARELARLHPEMVENVITMASPFGEQAFGHPVKEVERIQQFYRQDGVDPRTPPPVPTTSIYSRGDWVTSWKEALNAQGGKSENVRVEGGHLSMPFNDTAIDVVLDRLAEKSYGWQPISNNGKSANSSHSGSR